MSATRESASELTIVLTATVIPSGVTASQMDPETRAGEYLRAVRFYLEFAPVIFLENSTYPLERHPEFQESARLRVRRFPPSAHPERGKGYQEFEMLDAWVASESRLPARWLKITGRYRVLNIVALLHECQRTHVNGLMIDQVRRSKLARTYVFCAGSDFYQQKLVGLYQKCDDQTGDWIERVLFRQLAGESPSDVRMFATQPRIAAVAGSTGASFPTGRTQWLIKQLLRCLNRVLDRQSLWYPK